MNIIRKAQTGEAVIIPIPSKNYFVYDDFDYNFFGDFWGQTFANGGSVDENSIKIDATHPGIWRLRINSSSSSRAGIRRSTSGNGLKTGGGILTFETLINIETLATTLQDYTATFGIGDNGNAKTRDHDHGIYFKYDRSVSTNWLIRTAKDSVITSTTTSVTVATGWTKLKFVINAAATSVEFFINGVSVGTITTNIPQPTPASNPADEVITPIYKVKKSAGTGENNFYLDYHLSSIEFTNPR